MTGAISSYISLLPLLSSVFATFVTSTPIERRAEPAAKPGFNRVWYDDWGHKNGITHNWNFNLGTSYPGQVAQWGTGEIQTYTNKTENIRIVNKVLYITPKKVKDAKGKITWTSGRLESKRGSQWACANGKKMLVEASIKLGSAGEAQQKGIWPAFWMLGDVFRAQGYKGWPEVGELDIMESVNGKREAWGLLHCGVYDGQIPIRGPCNEPDGRGGSVKGIGRGLWHTYGIEIDRTTKNWKTEKVTWIINGVRRHSITGSQINNSTAWEFLAHKKMFILLNVAVGGGFPNGVEPGNALTPFSTTIDGDSVGMQVDWVGVWQQA
ncbi:hypothetical protein TWF225_007097 [Orbilia oligospora]|nr:hypothetical protein TWF225_007097 [Orbilia oligospora]KAF3270060.1 hypothetical protein TWF217_008402 [Orbilia oligospora]KAF3270531.1 hypothetical protein TWF128_004291 [Orbilia oligospora]KAF3276474.1 hypothetical protein TWF132_002182 [Orbilia oligospora]